MATIYDRTDIYDLFETEQQYQAVRNHWDTMFEGKNIQSVLDVSIGTGGLTLPMSDMGIALFGSDLSESMLARCREKANARGQQVDLRQCDFRNLTSCFDRKFDCVVSTGNSLPYVPNSEIGHVLAQMDALVEPGGYLYVDLRNWDKILSQHQRFFTYNPVFVGENRINLVQVWDHHADGSITFNLLYTFEKDHRIFQTETFEEHYYPVRQQFLLDQLEKLGYRDIQVLAFPAQLGSFRMEQTDWYCMIAKKP